MTELGGRQALGTEPQANPWNALWAMLVGFFMILVDSTIVAVANPHIMESLGADYDAVIWVTSAYLLAYAVPLLIAGRLGDRFGPKNLYLAGLAVFTVASLWCGLSGSISMLIAARVLQGVGAALLTPQTLSTITRIFPPNRRGVAMSVWGATAGVATLVGPLAGGVLVDTLGWQWIFIVNVPIGVIGLALAVWLIPVLPTENHRFDILGVVLSGLGMFLIVFGLQEGQSHDWALWIWAAIIGGIASIAGFVYWQAVNENEPLIPLRIFRDRNFSLANVGGAVIGFVITAFIVPVMFYAQAVSGLTPTRSALLTAPMAVTTGLLAPVVGRIVDRAHPRPIVGFGFSMLAISLTWLSIEMTPTTPIWRLVLPLMVLGVATAFIFSPLAATATRNLPPDVAGAASGVYNATRQVGSVIGSAAIAAFMTSRISAEMPGGQQAASGDQAVTALPGFLHAPFAAALSQSLLLPAFVALFGVIAALFLLDFASSARSAMTRAAVARGDARTEVIPVVRDTDADDTDNDDHDDTYATAYDDDYDHTYDDDFADDEYVPVEFNRGPGPDPYEPITDRLPVAAVHRQPTPVDEPNGFAHNGFHVHQDDAQHQEDLLAGPVAAPQEAPTGSDVDSLSARFAELWQHGVSGDDRPEQDPVPLHPEEFQELPGSRPGRHYREDSDDAPAYGRHSHREN
ncbi:MFS transporter [Mycolicibacterium mengxianglii]|uniref:MFS transporter n=1 Tax=Mycolicibacterium mengxianglii TaxID=2736649 RepID=UPI0018D06F75|nr:MFS transporter [Mycolicibacterium mengxianglii]